MTPFDAIVALGSNIGDKAQNIAAAISALTRDGDVAFVSRSRNYRTPPWGVTDQDWFVNACVAVKTVLAPRALLERCLAVERELGRVRVEKWGPRVIDLDLLVYRDETIADADLILPHPRITERAFVLAPLADIAPDLCLEGKSVRAWLAATDTAGVEPLP